MKSLLELRAQLAEVDQHLQVAWIREREEARQRIAELAVEFQLSLATVSKDIEAAQRRAPPKASVLRVPTVDLPLRARDAVQWVQTKYRNNATGDTWSGRGPRPRWLRDALAAGAVLEDFLVRSVDAISNDPLRDFQDAARREVTRSQG